MESKTVIIPVKLDDDRVIHVHAIDLDSDERTIKYQMKSVVRKSPEAEAIEAEVQSFDEIASTIEQISTRITESLQKAKPSKATVEFGIEVGVEAGKLTSCLVGGSAKATFQITLEWTQPT